MPTTTIQIDLIAKQRLDRLKEKFGVSTYNDVIHRITDEQQTTARAMFGSLKGIGPWKREYRMRSKYE
jgi:predicted CopG family antitoxin